MAQLLFGQSLTNLSAFQALQLANAVATLAGRGGVGIINRLRTGFGLDDLDVQTDSEGGATVRAGKYLSENVYSEVQVDGQGQSQINLNLDLTDSITLRGSAGFLCATGLMQSAATLEEAIDRGQEELEPALEALERAIAALVGASAPWR